MRKIIITCDHCGKELDEMHDYPEQEVGLVGYTVADLCNDCLEELDGIINKFCGKETNNDRT